MRCFKNTVGNRFSLINIIHEFCLALFVAWFMLLTGHLINFLAVKFHAAIKMAGKHFYRPFISQKHVKRINYREEKAGAGHPVEREDCRSLARGPGLGRPGDLQPGPAD